MDETILFPSPNWFQPSGLAVSTDEWLVYGGPSKSLCVLEPLPPDHETVIKERQGYTAHVVNRAHPEKIIAVDICPEWPEKRCVLTGSTDGTVKQWSLEKTQKSLKLKSTHSHEIHSHEKEEVVGVGYCKDGYAVTVGSFGHIVKWDLNSNVAKSFNHVLKSFKPVCMACSPHVHMHVAIGTKQGVLFVLDLNGSPRIIYKVRGQDDEILKVSWCPQYEVAVRKALKESDKHSPATERLRKIQQEPEAPETMRLLDERVKNSHTTEQPVQINEMCEPITDAASPEPSDESGISKTLPEDSFDDTVVQEDDMFDIYKDHEADEFGHKKYQPFDVVVKVAVETVQEDYLTECQKLKEEILKRNMQSDTTIGELVDAMDKTQLETKPREQPGISKPNPPVEGKITKGEVESSVHIHKHLLATIGKHGSVRVWSKSGKLVGSCAVFSGAGGGGGGKAARGARRSAASTLLWARPDCLLLADGHSQLLDCNPLKLGCKNKLEWSVLHGAHARGLFALGCSCARAVRPGEGARAGAVWSAAQDRSLARTCLATRRVTTHMTCGGFLYTVRPCPYDATRVAVSAGDGNVRVWEVERGGAEAERDGAEAERDGAEAERDGAEAALRSARVLSYWQNVMGKILVTAWHPRKENLLAFATAEARVGLLDTGGKHERAARVLQPAIAGGVYSLCWGDADTLYACGAGTMVRYRADQPERAPDVIAVELEGARWEVSTAQWLPRGVLVGSGAGAVGVLDHDHHVLAAAFVFNKMVHSVEWHPHGMADAGGAEEADAEAPHYGSLIAACSQARANSVVLLEYQENDDGSKKLSVWRTLLGHGDTVLQLAWSPHRARHLLSTSQDGTVRIWDVRCGSCESVFGGHAGGALGAAWLPWPALPHAVLSGGADCCLRLWRADRHPADQYQALKHEVSVDKKNKKQNKRERPAGGVGGAGDAGGAGGVGGAGDAGGAGGEEHAVATKEIKRRYNKKFLLPVVDKQASACPAGAARAMLQQHLARGGAAPARPARVLGADFIDMFGNINELNALLDAEMERHADTGAEEAWCALGVLRGHVDGVLARAAQRNCLDPFLLSIAPCVSFKYWKDTTLLYLQQIDRLIAKGEESKLDEPRSYGGPLFRKVGVLLSLHDVKGAVSTFVEARLYKEAYVLSRTRYMDSLAEQTLRGWAQFCLTNGQHNLSAVCFIALGDLSAAATALGKSSDEESLSLAADIAKILGQNVFAGHIEEKRHLLKSQKEDSPEDDLKELPTKAELMVKQAQESAKELQDDEDKDEENSATKEAEDQLQDEKDIVQDKLVNKENSTTELLTEEVQDRSETVQDAAQKTSVVPEGKGDHSITAKTEELLEELPEKMKGLMKVQKDVVLNGTHQGEGDTIQNGGVKDNEVNTKVLEKGDKLSQEIIAE